MKPKLFAILSIFFTLSLFSIFGCAGSQKAYDGPRLPHDQIARIICENRPIEIKTLPTVVSPGNLAKLSWKTWGATSKTLDVLPGTYDIKVKVYAKKYPDIYTFWHRVRVKAGHIYKIKCYIYGKTGNCDVSDVTGHEKF